MIDNKYSKLVTSSLAYRSVGFLSLKLNLTTKLLYVYCGQCRQCNYTIVVSNTDMSNCYCDSVYSRNDKQLVIVPLTAKEFYNGQLGRLDVRINAIYPRHNYPYYGNMICPY